jgi:hypothetical protein
MAIIFVFGLLVFYRIVLRRHARNGSVLAMSLWLLYMSLGISGIFLALTKGIEPIFDPNYLSTLVLFSGVILSISGFLRFRAQDISQLFGTIRGQRIIENLLILSQLSAIIFFLPFAISSLSGDANENRLFLNEKMEIMSSYGLLNTLAGAASQLFSSSLVLAFIRLASKENQGRDVVRACILVFSSLSYVIYILAYVGRDGVVYWLMTSIAIFVLFHRHLGLADRRRVTLFGSLVAATILIPFGVITIARFFDADQGAGWSFFEYFGAQIQNFSDYSSINRPITYGVANFPIFVSGGCAVLGLDCPSWLVIKDSIFDEYLSQGKAPWLFGTFISDFVGDFGNVGALTLLVVYSILCKKACSVGANGSVLSLSRFFLILFLFLIPYWGVFYFRLSIINGYIIINLAFVIFVGLLQRLILILDRKEYVNP